jgi:formylglycine-generating enzyme
MISRHPFHRFGMALILWLVSISPTLSNSAPLPVPPPGMVYIPDGYAQVGDTSGADDARPMHFVSTSAFFMDKYEVSNSEYSVFVAETGHIKPRYWDDERFNQPDQPVVGVSWEDAMAYAHWKGGRLPTEAEWEKAARGDDGRPYPWGRKWDKGSVFYFLNIFGEVDQYKQTAPVDYYQSGASPYGAYNMAGNVWEWCLDWYDPNYYKTSPEINPEGPLKPLKMKVLRGGSWINSIDSVTTYHRARNYPRVKNEIYGFRTVIPIR